MTHSNVVPVPLIVSTGTDVLEPTATISPHYSNDIGIAVNNRHNLSVAEKLELIQNPYTPNTGTGMPYNFPTYTRMIKKSTDSTPVARCVRFNPHWLNSFPWLAYSPRYEGGFCIPCVLFAPHDVGGQTLNTLVKTPLSGLQYVKAVEMCKTHQKKAYHTTSAQNMDTFISTVQSPRGNVSQQNNASFA